MVSAPLSVATNDSMAETDAVRLVFGDCVVVAVSLGDILVDGEAVLLRLARADMVYTLLADADMLNPAVREIDALLDDDGVADPLARSD